MRNDLTELNFIIDSSGSMDNLRDDTIGGFNSLLDKQKLETGYANVTTRFFNGFTKIIHNHVDIREVNKITKNDYCPAGSTALLDSLGGAIEEAMKMTMEQEESQRASKVLFVVITDGEENSSRVYTKEKVKTLVDICEKLLGWKFLFIGANVDSFSEAGQIGISNIANYSPSSVGTRSVYGTVGETVSCYRSNGIIQEDWNSEIK